LRRLFSTFARGSPGTGLLLMRLVLGISLIANGVVKFQAGQAIELEILNILTIVVGALVTIGLWTPIAGFLVMVLTIWGARDQHTGVCPAVLSATIGAGLALVGPGAWSLDAWLFGWKRIDLED
jgi:putative oxidoreductase